MSRNSYETIKEFIYDRLMQGESDVVGAAASEFGVSRQAIYKHVNVMVDEGIISKKGKGRGTTYVLERRVISRIFDLADNLAEDIIWSDFFASVVEGLPDNVQEICHYVFTEMVNNAIDHSGGGRLEITMDRDSQNVIIEITDDGEGIFKKIKRSFDLLHEEQALFELSKGKLTTDPNNHSGEGIFFSSRMMDGFFIFSGDKQFLHSSDVNHDWFEPLGDEWHQGTRILCGIAADSERSMEEVFDKFAMPDEFTFARTMIPMKLAEYDDQKLVSRSQAKRVLSRVEKFKYVEFNFEGVESIGQGFADEIFRVYANKNPDIKLLVVNANDAVERMIVRAESKDN